jgi:hypothetical protein
MIVVPSEKDYSNFVQLLDHSILGLKKLAESSPECLRENAGLKFEKIVFDELRRSKEELGYQGRLELISGQRFPDIVSYVNKVNGFGLEVKTTREDKWRTVGSSIFEGTRISNLSKINLLFAKFGQSIEFMCKKYEDCLYDVAITHSPRYLIDMCIDNHETIFSKINISYDILRSMDNPFDPIRTYYKSLNGNKKEVWWLSNEEKVTDLSIHFWKDLKRNRKSELIAELFALFPTLFSNSTTKFQKPTAWLMSKHNIIDPSFRDKLTAGGKKIIYGVKMPKIYFNFHNLINEVRQKITELSNSDIRYYWEIEPEEIDRVQMWKKISKNINIKLTPQQRQVFNRIIDEI